VAGARGSRSSTVCIMLHAGVALVVAGALIVAAALACCGSHAKCNGVQSLLQHPGFPFAYFKW
jgi:hypothetical protein